jgi:hypothetical protein
MQVGPVNPVLQGVTATQDTGAVRQQAASARAESARAVAALARGDGGRESLLQTKRNPEDDDRSKPKPRGSLVDIIA